VCVEYARRGAARNAKRTDGTPTATLRKQISYTRSLARSLSLLPPPVDPPTSRLAPRRARSVGVRGKNPAENQTAVAAAERARALVSADLRRPVEVRSAGAPSSSPSSSHVPAVSATPRHCQRRTDVQTDVRTDTERPISRHCRAHSRSHLTHSTRDSTRRERTHATVHASVKSTFRRSELRRTAERSGQSRVLELAARGTLRC